jgi:hypothetical protein
LKKRQPKPEPRQPDDSQLDLTPFMPGGFVSEWMKLLEATHPDVVRSDPWACKLVGAALLAHVAKVFYNDFRLPPATLYLILVGKPRSGKGSILSAASAVATELGVNVVGDATPEALAQELEENWNTMQIWEDVGRSITEKGKDYYEGLHNLLNNLYFLSPVKQIRKQAKSVLLKARSYLFSFVWDTTPEEWGAVEEVLRGPTGFTRRTLPVRMSDAELPYFKFWEPTPEAHRHLLALKLIAEELKDKAFLVDLGALEASGLEERIRGLEVDRNARSRISDYVKKLTALALVDSVIRVIEVRGRLGVKITPSPHVRLFKQPIENSLTLLTSITTITTYNLTITEPKAVIDRALTTYNQVVEGLGRFTLLADEEVQRYAELTKEFLRRRGSCTKKEWWLQVMKGKKKRYVDEVQATLEGMGVVRAVVIGRTTHFVNPELKVCGTCRHFMAPTCKLRADPSAQVVWEELLMEEGGECWEPWE